MSLEIHPLRKDKSLSDGTPVVSTSILGSHLSFINHEDSTSVHSTSVHGLFSKVLVHSYHLSQIVDIYIHIATWTVLFSLRDTIRDKLLEENTLCRFPYQEKTGKKWFKHNVSSGGDQTTRTISMLNLYRTSDSFPELDGAAYPPSDKGGEEGFTILCHGTVHQSAKNIIEKGIRLNKLNKEIKGDFSDKEGFYLTGFRKAREWAFSKFAKTAILVFKIRNEEIDRYRPESLNLMGEDNEKKWKEFVANEDIIADKIEGISFVEGPWIKREEGAVKTDEKEPHSYQMCVLDEEMAEMIDRHLHSVVFYNTTRRGR